MYKKRLSNQTPSFSIGTDSWINRKKKKKKKNRRKGKSSSLIWWNCLDRSELLIWIRDRTLRDRSLYRNLNAPCRKFVKLQYTTQHTLKNSQSPDSSSDYLFLTSKITDNQFRSKNYAKCVTNMSAEFGLPDMSTAWVQIATFDCVKVISLSWWNSEMCHWSGSSIIHHFVYRVN